ncbi:MAG TPA: shikimate dehydrogenase [Flavobacterium sp.]|uniref:shikimate dehydrogenase family protein n=1 Tax=Flavobacterium sp. TaxID=239 RepID=UPI002C5FB62B|nr:shikimate dehydrogenase [Flavobacterium sp.]HPW97804.1 shikimate dehydrogenase [Flavobacterium sp.]HQA73765.1 shikimate dehydrogenase [Flavobacterium sp.]
MSKRQFGLIGKNISYSFSKKYFTEKFALGNLEDYFYENFDLQSIDEFPEILKNNSDLKGLNVTIPFKETIIPYLDKLSKNAQKIGAVNVIRFTKKGSLKGYNSDYYGFIKSLKPLLKEHHKKALILGTGGASKGIAFGLEKLGILYTFVSREEKEGMINYNRINATTFDNYKIIINCTPLGTSPNVKEFPNLPYQFFTKKHIAFDLIYNPEETQFLKKAKKKGATIKNGFEMLQYQAEKSWKIWNK